MAIVILINSSSLLCFDHFWSQIFAARWQLYGTKFSYIKNIEKEINNWLSRDQTSVSNGQQ